MTGGLTTWARRLGWGLVPVFVVAVATWVPTALGIDPGPWPLLPVLIVIFLIGVRVGEWWWVWVPPAMLVVLWLALAVWALVLDPPWDPMATGILVVGGGLIAVFGGLLLGLAAASGVWWRQRREDDFPFQSGDPPHNSRFGKG